MADRNLDSTIVPYLDEKRCIITRLLDDNRAFSVKMRLLFVKRYSVVSQVYRNRTKDFDDHLMLSAAGLWNFYLVAA